MICPACNTEFPHGTVFCSRCHVTLVADLAEADEMVEKAYPGSALVQLWRGEDAALRASILEALAEANIPFYEQPLGSGPSARPIDQLLDHAHPRFGFEVAVLSSNLAEAEVILEKLLNEGPVDMALTANEDAAQAVPKAKSLAIGQATCEVWSGDDENLAGFLGAALKENGIPIRVERHGQEPAVYAPPEDEGRAREIIREIVEGAPPEWFCACLVAGSFSPAEVPMKNAALGFRVHSGWTAVVAVSTEFGEKASPCILARQRVHLVETFTYEFRQPYHTAGKMLLGQARDFIERVRDEARRLAHRAIRGLQSDLQKQGIVLKKCGLVLASGRPLPELEKILASHALIHTADGELFREAIVHSGARLGLRTEGIKERELLERAAQVLRVRPAALIRRVTELGRPLGSPWSQDEKFATLAAWLALAAPLARERKARSDSPAA